MIRRALVLLLALTGAACGRHLSPPSASSSQLSAQIEDDAPEAFASMIRADDRVLRIADRLRTSNTEKCGDKVGSDLGWIALADRDFPGHAMRDLARDFLKVRREPVVVAVAPGGAAASAGVRVGDRVQEIGGQSVANYREVARAEGDLPATGATIVVEREGEQLELAVQPARACSQGVVVVEAPGIVAMLVEGQIAVTFRLVEVASDDELAFALAHTLALDIVAGQWWEGAISDVVPEPETTRLAVELSERAGFSVDDVEGLLELQAVEQPAMVMAARPKAVKLGEIPRRLVALRMVRANPHPATQDAH